LCGLWLTPGHLPGHTSCMCQRPQKRCKSWQRNEMSERHVTSVQGEAPRLSVDLCYAVYSLPQLSGAVESGVPFAQYTPLPVMHACLRSAALLALLWRSYMVCLRCRIGCSQFSVVGASWVGSLVISGRGVKAGCVAAWRTDSVQQLCSVAYVAVAQDAPACHPFLGISSALLPLMGFSLFWRALYQGGVDGSLMADRGSGHLSWAL
jgi:hypothetical protein